MGSRWNATLSIIAGGRASRLGGVPKGLLRIEGFSILERQLRLRDLFEHVLLVASNPTPYQSFHLRTVPDLIRDKGAPGGVHSALAHAATPWVVAVGCDMPFVSAAVVQALMQQRCPEDDGVCFEVGGRLQPLLGAYRAGASATWAEALDENPSFARLFKRIRVRVLPESYLRGVDSECRAVLGINSPADLARMGAELPVLSV